MLSFGTCCTGSEARSIQPLLDPRDIKEPVIARRVTADRPSELELMVARVVEGPVAEEDRVGCAQPASGWRRLVEAGPVAQIGPQGLAVVADQQAREVAVDL